VSVMIKFARHSKKKKKFVCEQWQFDWLVLTPYIHLRSDSEES